MNFLHYTVQGDHGDQLRIKLSEPAFVRLLDVLNYEYYRTGRRFKGEGGWSDLTDVQFFLPYRGTFHLVVDLGGKAGVVKATMDVIRA